MNNFDVIGRINDLCKARAWTEYGIAKFFSEHDETILLSKKQKECLAHWDRLDSRSQELALAYMEALAARQEPDQG